MKKIYKLKNLSSLFLDIKKPCIIFLKGDLGSGKTTLSKHILNNLLCIKQEITSPTYTYFNKYLNNYHFDLYRLRNYDEFFSISGEEILDNNSGVILIEWPEIIENYYKPDIEISLKETGVKNEREINIFFNSKKI